MVEEFRPVRGYERYYVSDLGRVLNTKTGRFLKMHKNNKTGYLQLGLWKDGKMKLFLIHRLVATAFIPNPDNLDTVDHINGQKNDNRACNLQWLSNHDNASKFHREQITQEQRKFYRENIKKTNEVCKKSIICLETGKIYKSITQASEELNLDNSNISKVCNGKIKQIHGLHFEYLLKE